MPKDVFENFIKNFKDIIEFTEEDRKLILENEQLVRRKLGEVSNDLNDNMKKIVEELYNIIIHSGNYEMTRELSKYILVQETGIKDIADRIAQISKKLQDSIEDENLRNALRKITLIALMLLFYEITQVFVDAVSNATGMSKELLMNFAKRRLQEV